MGWGGVLVGVGVGMGWGGGECLRKRMHGCSGVGMPIGGCDVARAQGTVRFFFSVVLKMG
jgi:hypothetical protein